MSQASPFSPDNRRRSERLKLSLKVSVTGHHRHDGKWQEMAETLDVSRTGLRLLLRRPVRPGLVLHLRLPLPWRMRQHGQADPTYSVYAAVHRVEPRQDELNMVGLEFIGATPPQSYLEKPWLVYRPAQWRGANRRREAREQHFEAVWVEYLTASLQPISGGQGRTENVSRSGARVCVQPPGAEFDLVKVVALESGFESLAVVTDRYPREDGLERLCLHFIGAQWPEKGGRREA
jgi:hypothetical protein